MKPFLPLIFLAGTLSLRAAPGDLDSAFSRPQAAKGAESFETATFAVIPAGDRFLVCEMASSYNLIPGGFITMHHEDGSRDTGFNASGLQGYPPTGTNGPLWMDVRGMTPDYFSVLPGQAGFAVLGYFSTIATHYYSPMAYRVDPSGSGSPSGVSQSASGAIKDFIVDYDGAVMAWGDFNKPVPGSPPPGFESLRIGFPRADQSLTLDSGIKWDYCYGLTALRDGDFLLQMQTYPAPGSDENAKFTLHRVHSGGALAASYAADSFLNAPVIQPDGRILVPGSFTAFAGQPVKYFVRLGTDGTLDTSFTPDLNGPVTSAILQADGKIVVGGSFTTVGGVDRRYLARLNADGTLDSSFKASLDQPVIYAGLQGNGKVFAVTNVASAPQSTVTAAISRHFNDPAVSALQRPARPTVQWLRGGSAPEVQVVTIDFRSSSTDEWRSLGKARRIAGGWELSDESLPEGGEFSAKGWILGENRRTGWVEATLETAPPALTLVQWRTLHFGSPDNTGGGADSADADGDGQINLLEYALGQDPKNGSYSPAGAAVWILANDVLESRFTTAATGTPLTFTAEWSENLETGPWQSITDTGEGFSHILRVPLEGRSKVFARTRISY